MKSRADETPATPELAGRIDDDRFRRRWDALAGIGRDPVAGWTRLAYSAPEAAARELVGGWLADAGLTVRVDAAGNLRARTAAADPTAPAVLTGSHLDTVPRGGCWDGSLGVVAAVEAVTALAGVRTVRPVEVVAFAAEESPRFRQSAYRFGSRAMAGLVGPADAAALADDDGITVAAAMRAVGLDPDRLDEARIDPAGVHALVELHIDQGRTLSTLDRPVGVVTAITGSRRTMHEVLGRADHSGAARMADRRDALAAAAELVLAAERVAGDELVATVGWLRVEPGAVSVVPGRVEFTLDLRSVSEPVLLAGATAADAAFREVAARRDVALTGTPIRDVRPVAMSPVVRDAITAAAAAVGVPVADVPSHAGHDAGTLAPSVPTGMVFVRNASGRSHSPAEDVHWPDAVAGAEVLAETLLRLAGEAA
jgi:allantoate deiminase